MKKKIYNIVFAAQYEGLTTKQATDKLLSLFSVVFSDQKERSRFQKDIDDCYAHEDEEESEAEVCLAPSYRIIGCEYNDGRTCDGCKWLPKQT